MSKEYQTTEYAREYFKNKELTYEHITTENLEILKKYIELELINYYLSDSDHAKQMDMILSKSLKKDIKFNNNGLEFAYLKVDGSYFNKREGISFNHDGFIGFSGEFSTVNTQPFIIAFIKWCDYIVK